MKNYICIGEKKTYLVVKQQNVIFLINAQYRENYAISQK